MSTPGQVAVIVPAAGEGKRLGGHRKQFRVLGGKSVLVQTLLVFERHVAVDHIIVATPKEAVIPLTDELKRVGISKLLTVVKGGSSRQGSVRAALKQLPKEVDLVLVHDAVRPFVRLSKVSNVIESVRLHGAGALAIGVSDTVRRAEWSEDGTLLFGETVPRDGLFRMQTPQGFRADWLIAAHEAAATEGFEATDDVDLVQRIGHDVVGVEGCLHNVKITTPDDWNHANRFWAHWQTILRHEEREQIAGQEIR